MIELVEDAKARLRSEGWASFQMPLHEMAALEVLALDIAYSLGEPRASRRGGKLVDYLIPTEPENAHIRSLSARYGLTEFPWHTDGAHWSTPPRYLVMGCLEADRDASDTLIAEGGAFDLLHSERARTALFRVTNGGNSFYATARDSFGRFYRYDPGCMTPMNDDAVAIASAMSEGAVHSEFKIGWRPGTFLLIDNWRFLHRRGAASGRDKRKLLRATVMEKH